MSEPSYRWARSASHDLRLRRLPQFLSTLSFLGAMFIIWSKLHIDFLSAFKAIARFTIKPWTEKLEIKKKAMWIVIKI